MNERVIYIAFFVVLFLIWGGAVFLIYKKDMLRRDVFVFMERQRERVSRSLKNEKPTFIEKMDRNLRYAGYGYTNWLSSEIYLMINGIVVVLLSVFTALIFRSALIAIGVMIVLAIISYLYLKMKITSRDKKVETELISMLDMMATLASSKGDIIEIFSIEADMLREPLKSCLLKCVSDAKSSGNTIYALNQLKESVHYEQFQFAIDNLITISEHNTNYEQVVDIMKEAIDKKIKSNEKIKAIFAKGRTELIAYIIVGFVSLFFVQEVCSVDIIVLLTTSGILGYALLIAYIAVLLYMLYVGFVKNEMR